jgi:hypothetical protein
MGKRRRKVPPVRARSGRHRSSVGWQLWVVAAGVAVVLATLGTALIRGTGPYRSEYEGTVVSKRSTPLPGEFDKHVRRQLTLEQEDGSLLTVEVEERLYVAVAEGYFVRRSHQNGLEISDSNGRIVTLQRQVRGEAGE